MIKFSPFFQINFAHDYFGDDAPPIRIQPDLTTRNLSSRVDLRIRFSRGRVECFTSDDRDALKLLAAREAEEKIETLTLKIKALKAELAKVPDGAQKLKALQNAKIKLASEEDVLSFTFRLNPQDSSLLGVSEYLDRANNQIPILDLSSNDLDRLPKNTPVGEAHLHTLQVDQYDVEDFFTDQDLIKPPLAIVRLRITPMAVDQIHHIQFAAVKRFWIYHVVGGDENARLDIRDRSGQIEFAQVKQPDESHRFEGLVVRSFRSDLEIPEKARPDGRFELRREGPFKPVTVISNLPGPETGVGTREGADMISEIFVNLW